MSLEAWKQEFENKKIIIWGFAREGKATWKLIRRLCPDLRLAVAEGRKKDLDDIRRMDELLDVFYDDEVDFNAYDMIMKSPGIVVRDGIDTSKVTEETDLFLKHYGDRTIGITGTKGKSTTTSLTYTLLKEGLDVCLVGNIGIPCFEAVDDMENGATACFELSCHQLEYAKHSPHIAVFLNLYEEHLDHYGTFENYALAKANILKYQKEGDIAIVHPSLVKYVRDDVKRVYRIGEDINSDGNVLHLPGHSLEVKECRLIGAHNYQNLAVAYGIAKIMGLSDEKALRGMAAFCPLPHRLEDLGEFHGIRYVNDSISTIGQSCAQAIRTLPDVDTVLVGGMDRGIDYASFEEYLAHDTDVNVIFMYAAGHRIHAEMKEKGFVRDGLYEVEDLAQAIRLARTMTREHHICLLSPAASSYDHFKNFEERGDRFRELAMEAE